MRKAITILSLLFLTGCITKRNSEEAVRATLKRQGYWDWSITNTVSGVCGRATVAVEWTATRKTNGKKYYGTGCCSQLGFDTKCALNAHLDNS